MKEKALGRLGKFVLTPSDRRRIAAIVLRAVDTVNRREFGDQAGAARHAAFEALAPGLIERMTLPVDRRSWQAYQAARSAVGWGVDKRVPVSDRAAAEIVAMRARLARLEF